MSTGTTTPASMRIMNLLDGNSFVEIGSLVSPRNTDFNLTKEDAPADGVITGYGTIDGSLVYVYSQNAAVLNGSVGEMHAKKIVNLYDLALKMGAPIIGLIDSAGLRLQEATDALNAFGTIYAKQVEASGVIPQITAVFGECGGGLAVLSELSDFTFMETKGHLFVNSPNALTGNKTEDTASAKFQAEVAGTVDFVGSEDEVLNGVRELVAILPTNCEDEAYTDCTDDLNRATAEIRDGKADPAYVLASLSDNNTYVEVKKDFAPEMATAFIQLNGATIGAVANRTAVFSDGKTVAEFDNVLTVDGCEKAAAFIRFCDAFNIPLLSLTDVKGYEATKDSEKKMASAAAKLTAAFASASVPKVNLITGVAFGSAYVVMNSKAIGADLTLAWPDTAIGMMDAAKAASILCADEPDKIAEKTGEYAALQDSVESAAKRGYVDRVVDPVDTRKYVISAYEMLYSKKTTNITKKHNTNI